MRVLSFYCLCAQLYGVCSLGAIMLIPHEKLSLGVLCLRITGVRRTLLSLLVITEIIMKLLWTCHDVEVFR